MAADVEILVRDNGPLRVYGPFRLKDPEGREIEVSPGEWVSLCRCGFSENKPFCDASHKHHGFQSVVRAGAGAGEEGQHD
jgi:CDGSH-type Zn-finger protein